MLRVALTFCAILAVDLVVHQPGVPDLRLSPAGVLTRYLRAQYALEVGP